MFDVALYVYLSSIAFSFVCSLVAWKNIKKIPYRFFSIFLAVTLLVEVTGNIIFNALHIKGRYRNELYNIFALAEFLFYNYFLMTENMIKWIKKVQLAFMILFPIAWVFMVSAGKGLIDFHGALIASGGFFIVCFSLGLLYSLSGDWTINKVSRSPALWILFGLILFYCCQTPYMGSMAYLVKYYLNLAGQLLYLSMAINTVMYSMFGYAFICLKKNY
jgi:hypothetical protein